MKKNEVFTLAAMLSVIVFLSVTFVSLVFGGLGVKLNVNGNVPTAATVQISTAAPVTQAPTIQTPPSTTQSASENPSQSATEASSKNENGLPSTNAEILAKYTEVMQYAKDSNPGYAKKEYQVIPQEKANFEGNIFNTILSFADMFIRTEKDANENPELHEKGQDMYWFPVYETEKGCLLKDDSAIKTANCEKMSDGNVKITIVLNDEINPEPAAVGATEAPSAHGGIFTPIARAAVDDTLKNNGAIKAVAKDIDFTLKYYDCTAILVYNPDNNQIVTLEQLMHTLITVNSGTILFSSAVGTAELDNHMYIYDFEY